ncbi:hypothetical protein M0804_011468 [Polistes exclamans]|nr:hypothetical protein M0804_011468 [Polistes exclamans]
MTKSVVVVGGGGDGVGYEGDGGTLNAIKKRCCGDQRAVVSCEFSRAFNFHIESTGRNVALRKHVKRSDKILKTKEWSRENASLRLTFQPGSSFQSCESRYEKVNNSQNYNCKHLDRKKKNYSDRSFVGDQSWGVLGGGRGLYGSRVMNTRSSSVEERTVVMQNQDRWVGMR